MRLPFRGQLALVSSLLSLFVLAGGWAYWTESSTQSVLQGAFRVDRSILVTLPRLRERLRQLDLLTDQYVLTGDPRALRSRARAFSDVRSSLSELGRVMTAPGSKELLNRLDGELTEFLSLQDQWIGRREAGRLSRAAASRIASRKRPFDEMAGLLIALQEEDHERLEERRLAAERASKATVWLILALGVASIGLLASWLSFYFVAPVSELELYASGWELGSPWELPPPEGGSEVRGLYLCLKGMSERLNIQFRMERELLEVKSQLVALVTHEFNNALNVIQGVTSLLEQTDGRGTSDRRAEYYQIVKANTRQLAFATRNILNMGRLESGRFAVTPSRTELGPILRDAVQRLGILAEQKQLEIELILPEVPDVLADGDSLSLVATNLLSNAIKYTPEKGRVTLGLSREEGGVRVFVEDTGIGMSTEEAGRIMSGQYYRTERGRQVAKGFGVGLSLAERIVEAHGSFIEVRTSVGKGSRFSFALAAWAEPVSALPEG